MKSLTLFLQYLLCDTGRWCGISTTLDGKTVERRVEHEGLSFLTITLPNFGKDFEKSLDQGQVTHDLFFGFSRRGGLPRFLGGFLELVFDRKTGRLLEEPDVTAIWSIRQVTLAMGKIKLPCSGAREDAAYTQYLRTEQEVREAERRLTAEQSAAFLRISSLLWSNVLQAVDEDVYYERIVPRHGPGATADRLKGNLKWMQHEWPERLEREFPSGNYLFSHPIHSTRADANVTWMEPGAERPVRVISVPKTLKTPRLIAIEPTCMQYVQQGILRSLVDAIQADHLASSLIGFSTQVPNQELAREGSLKGELATLDLSEASDRVSNQHVRILLSRHPSLAGGVDACRSRKADVLGEIYRLAKFASMGSALTFPMEAMVFATVVFMGIESDLSRRLTKKDVQSYLGRVRVYGDDIIAPVDHVPSVVAQLEAFGFRVNASKSFWSGKFRESCGKEYYAGHDVSVVRLREELPTHRQQVPEIVSTVETRNQLYFAGLWATAGYLDDVLERTLTCRFYPHVSPSSPVLGRNSFLVDFETHRMSPSLHRPEVKGWVQTSRLPASPLDGTQALLKCLLAMEERLPSARRGTSSAGTATGRFGIQDYCVPDVKVLPARVDFDTRLAHLTGLPPGEEHLRFAGRPQSSTLKLRYASSV